jgi:peptide/nickel transport system substrate-binding protein
MMGRISIFLGKLALASALVSGLAWSATATPSMAASGESVLTIGMAADPVTLDPNLTRDTTSNMYYGNMFEGLYDLDANGTPQPSLAVSYKVIDDLTWEFKLRPGVKFHDGTDFNADAVKFTYERTLNPSLKTGWRSFIDPVDRVDVVDPNTVRIHTKSPFPTLLAQLSYLPVVSPAAVKKLGDTQFGKTPVGTGPYKFTEWVAGTRLVMDAFDGYWRGAARIKRIVLRPIPELSTRISELETGGVDIIMQVPPDQVARLKKNSSLQIVGVASTQPMVLQVNTRAGNATLKDPRVRAAISLAIDRGSVKDQLLLGEATLINGPVTPEYLGYDSGLPSPAYDPEKAKQLLKDAKAVGTELKYSTPSGRYVQDTQIAEIVAEQLRAIGFKVNIEPLEIAQYVQRLQNRTIGDLVYIGIGSEDLDAGTVLQVYFGGDSVWSQYADPDLDKSISSVVPIVDHGAREAAAKAAVKKAVDESAGIWLWDAKYLFGMNKRVKVQPHSGDWHPIVAYEAELTN